MTLSSPSIELIVARHIHLDSRNRIRSLHGCSMVSLAYLGFFVILDSEFEFLAVKGQDRHESISRLNSTGIYRWLTCRGVALLDWSRPLLVI
jgi:hypothetical protein